MEKVEQKITIETETERIFSVIRDIEDKLYFPETDDCKATEACPGDKVTSRIIYLGYIVNRLEKIADTLTRL